MSRLRAILFRPLVLYWRLAVTLAAWLSARPVVSFVLLLGLGALVKGLTALAAAYPALHAPILILEWGLAVIIVPVAVILFARFFDDGRKAPRR